MRILASSVALVAVLGFAVQGHVSVAAAPAAPFEPMTKGDRQRLLAHLEMTEQWLGSEIARLSPAQLTFRMTPDSWSITDVVEHLSIAEPQYWQMVLDSMSANGLEVDDFISVIFTATSDLVSEFPAYAARQLGFGEVPLLCARELEIERSMPRVVRMLAHVETDLPRADITHVYLHGAAALRTDLTRVQATPDE